MVRERADMRCQFFLSDGERCPAEVGRGLAAQGLHAAHCFGRGNPRTRLDPDNGLALCWPHHREVDGDKSLRYWLFTRWIGDDRFIALEAKAHARRDRSVR